jgi:hypothetical protein
MFQQIQSAFNFRYLILLIACPLLQAQTCDNNIPATTPTSRFVFHNNGTVTDTQTKLTWQRCVEGRGGVNCESGGTLLLDWEQALQRAENSTFANHNDWRLPNIRELRSIIEFQCSEPMINLSVFPGDQLEFRVWTSTPRNSNQGANIGYSRVVFFDQLSNSRTSLNSIPRKLDNGLTNSLVYLVRGGN